MEAWLPTIIATGALSLIFAFMRIWRTELIDKINEVKNDVKESLGVITTEKGTFMTHNEHKLLCENAALLLQKHVTRELIDLKDAVFAELRKTQDLIKNGRKGQTDR